MSLDLSTRILVLQIATALHSQPDASKDPDSILVTASKFAGFVESEATAITGSVKPAKVVRAVKAAESPQLQTFVVEPETATVAAAQLEAVAEVVVPEKVQPRRIDTLVTAEDVKKVIGQLAVNAEAGGAVKAREILGKYGATNLSTLKPEYYASAKKNVDDILAQAALAA